MHSTLSLSPSEPLPLPLPSLSVLLPSPSAHDDREDDDDREDIDEDDERLRDAQLLRLLQPEGRHCTRRFRASKVLLRLWLLLRLSRRSFPYNMHLSCTRAVQRHKSTGRSEQDCA